MLRQQPHSTLRLPYEPTGTTQDAIFDELKPHHVSHSQATLFLVRFSMLLRIEDSLRLNRVQEQVGASALNAASRLATQTPRKAHEVDLDR